MKLKLLKLVKHPDYNFNQRCEKPNDEVDAIEPRHVAIADALVDLMLENGLRALAAPQAGMRERIMVFDWSNEGEPPNPIRMFGPSESESNVWMTPDKFGWETCVSLPGVREWVRRSGDVEIFFRDENSEGHYYIFSGEDAVLAQRTLDYLDGKSIMSSFDRPEPRLKPHETRDAFAKFSVSRAFGEDGPREGWVSISHWPGMWTGTEFAQMNPETGEVEIRDGASEALPAMIRDIVRRAGLEIELTEEEKAELRMQR